MSRLPDRLDRVAAIKAQVRAGTYQIDALAVADAILARADAIEVPQEMICLSCSGPKGPRFALCAACHNARPHKPYDPRKTCACGRPMGQHSRRCIECRREAGQMGVATR